MRHSDFLPHRVLVTGARGSVGTALVKELNAEEVFAFDLDLDVRERGRLESVFWKTQPSLVYHLAGAKSAPSGEADPITTFEINTVGTRNVLRAAEQVRARVITASTCKACDPETVYGASKLLAERMTLHAGGSVARFYNVRESSGNVFEIWRMLPEGNPIPYTPCHRYFISMDQAVDLLLRVAHLEPGRYTINPGKPQYMATVAWREYPGRRITRVFPRKGDRIQEPRCAFHESIEVVSDGVERIHSSHDREPN